MFFISYLLIFGALALIAIQDFKFREINWIWIPLLFFGVTIKSLLLFDKNIVIDSFLYNSLFMIFQLGILVLYFSLRNKKIEPVINSYLGIGDLLFLGAVAPALCFGNFLLFIVASLLLILFLYSLAHILNIKTRKQIPLAGWQALFYSAWLFGDGMMNHELSYIYLPLLF